MKIGVFDSGVGGISVANAIKKALPGYQVVYVDDKENIPYGNKSPNELFSLVMPKIKGLEQQDCEVIVIACNTVSTTLAERIRQVVDVPIIAIEPMIKPAAKLTKTKKVTVCATPTTLSSSRYNLLKKKYAKGIDVVEPDCSDWSYMIENDVLDRHRIEEVVELSCSAGSDVIVLGCTHYHWIEDLIIEIAKGRALVIQPEEAIVKQVQRTLELPA